MNRKIFSKINNQLLVSIISTYEQDTLRVDSASEAEILQVCSLKLPAGRKVKPHKHLPIKRETLGTQECWIVLKGKLSVQIFDINDDIIETFIINQGDCMTTYNGGHTLTVLDDAVVVEVKNGPYYGSALDSASIDIKN